MHDTPEFVDFINELTSIDELLSYRDAIQLRIDKLKNDYIEQLQTRENKERLQKHLFEIQVRLDQLRKQSILSARTKIQEMANELGCDVADLVPELATKFPVKYINKTDPSQTWAGRGRQPRWLTKALAEGYCLDDFKI